MKPFETRSHFNPRSPCGERQLHFISKEVLRRISIHAPRVGSDSVRLPVCLESGQFQSTLPVWGATFVGGLPLRTREEFQSTLPVWGATSRACVSAATIAFQSTLPVWGATRRRPAAQDKGGISIHAPRVGSDSGAGAARQSTSYFNPRSPCGERRRWVCMTRPSGTGFQSTLPVWGATRPGDEAPGGSRYFNPRSPCGERPGEPFQLLDWELFQSTLPVWGATLPCPEPHALGQISIHAPRVGSDASCRS